MKRVMGLILPLLVISCQGKDEEPVRGSVDMRLILGTWEDVQVKSPQSVYLVELNPGAPEISSPEGNYTVVGFTPFACPSASGDTCYHDVRTPSTDYSVGVKKLISSSLTTQWEYEVTKLTEEELYMYEREGSSEHYRRIDGKVLVDTTAEGIRTVRWPKGS